MTNTPRADYVPSHLHQGTRSRTGDQVDRQLVHDLLGLLGDCRLLWLPNLTDTTTSLERSRHGATITWSESLASFDGARARLGSGVSVPFNGSDEEGDVPDAARYSFGDGVADQAFSLVVLASFDTVGDADLISKFDATTGSTKREYRMATVTLSFTVPAAHVVPLRQYINARYGSAVSGMTDEQALEFHVMQATVPEYKQWRKASDAPVASAKAALETNDAARATASAADVAALAAAQATAESAAADAMAGLS